MLTGDAMPLAVDNRISNIFPASQLWREGFFVNHNSSSDDRLCFGSHGKPAPYFWGSAFFRWGDLMNHTRFDNTRFGCCIKCVEIGDFLDIFLWLNFVAVHLCILSWCIYSGKFVIACSGLLAASTWMAVSIVNISTKGHSSLLYSSPPRWLRVLVLDGVARIVFFTKKPGFTALSDKVHFYFCHLNLKLIWYVICHVRRKW